jgi:peptidoglycan/xylan/chitin deacetylase (PgdA/CDA1 family)
MIRPLIAGLLVATFVVFATAQSDAQSTGRAIALTFDDLPLTRTKSLAVMKETTALLLRTLATEQVPAIGFVNEQKLFESGDIEQGAALLEAWLDAGADLRNHTYSHVSIDRVPFEQYRDDLIRGESVTKRLLESRGRRLRYFRHPQLRTGPTLEYKRALEALLAERGYRVAPVTIDNNDFVFADIYSRARDLGDLATMQRVGDAYVPYMESVVAHFEQLSRDFLGYEVPQVLLLHPSELNGDYLDNVVAMLRRRSYRFVTLDVALADPAYALPDVVAARGLSWLHRWMQAKALPLRMEPLEPMWVRELFRR